jgi:hypothetical protein
MLKTTCATIALLALSVTLADPALAAGCASPAEAAALKTAVMQQELMVAALQCHETSAYNHFVIAYRPELQDSDAALKAFFVRRGGEHGEAGYDTFKTKAANLSALEQARDTRAFCADAHILFQAALANHGSLMSFVDTRSGGTDIGSICVESRPAPLAVRTADVRPVEVAPVPAAAAAVRIPTAPVKVAAAPVKAIRVADVRPADEAVGGVPAYNEPSIPYARANAAPPPERDADRDARDRDDEEQAQPAYEQDEAPPPPRPRYYQIRNPSYASDDYNNYAPPPPRPYSYGPPPGWSNYNYPAPQPSYSYPPRGGYYNW